MGCTHYPIIEAALARFMGDGVTLINPGLEAARLLKQDNSIKKNEHGGNYKFFVSDDAEGFHELGSLFLGGEMRGDVAKIQIGK